MVSVVAPSRRLARRAALAYVLAMATLTSAGPATGAETMSLTLTSPAFEADTPIPRVYTCEGADISPPLAWQGVPPGTRSLALVVDDPDAPDPAAPRMTWVHWLLYDLPPEPAALPEAVGALPPGSREGRNSWDRTGYGGPCPPIGRHRYFFKLYALDTVLPDLERPDEKALIEAMHGHILGETRLIGTYRKAR